MNKLKLQKQFLTELESKGFQVVKLCEVGSYLYGNPKPTSDYDLRAVVMPTMTQFCLGDVNFTYQTTLTDDNDNKLDYVAYSLHKFVEMWAKGSPNVLDVLYAPTLHGSHSEVMNLLQETYNHKFLAGCLGQSNKVHRDTKELNSQVRGLLSALEYVSSNQVSYPQYSYLHYANGDYDMVTVKAELQKQVQFLYESQALKDSGVNYYKYAELTLVNEVMSYLL